MITDYAISTADNFEDLVTEVNTMLKDGWQPHGRFFRDRNTRRLCQPMVKHGEEEK